MSSSSLCAPYMGHHGNGKEATQDREIPREDNPSTTVYTRDKDSRLRDERLCRAEENWDERDTWSCEGVARAIVPERLKYFTESHILKSFAEVPRRRP